jgi:hypothetical protein
MSRHQRAVHASPDLLTEQLFLRHALEARPALRQQLGSTAYAQLLDVVTCLGEAQPTNSIWIETLFPAVLAVLQRECPELRSAIARVTQVLDSRRYSGPRVQPERQMWNPYDTLEEQRWER